MRAGPLERCISAESDCGAISIKDDYLDPLGRAVCSRCFDQDRPPRYRDQPSLSIKLDVIDGGGHLQLCSTSVRTSSFFVSGNTTGIANQRRV